MLLFLCHFPPCLVNKPALQNFHTFCGSSHVPCTCWVIYVNNVWNYGKSGKLWAISSELGEKTLSSSREILDEEINFFNFSNYFFITTDRRILNFEKPWAPRFKYGMSSGFWTVSGYIYRKYLIQMWFLTCISLKIYGFMGIKWQSCEKVLSSCQSQYCQSLLAIGPSQGSFFT